MTQLTGHSAQFQSESYLINQSPSQLVLCLPLNHQKQTEYPPTIYWIKPHESPQCQWSYCQPSWPIVPVHCITGLVSAQPKSEIGWSHSCEGVNMEATVLQPLKNYVRAVSDTKLFQLVVADPKHTLHSLLPLESTFTYNLRPRSHNLTLPDKHSAVDSCNFVTRMLYAKCYWLCNCYSSLLSCLQLWFVICIINEDIHIYVTALSITVS